MNQMYGQRGVVDPDMQRFQQSELGQETSTEVRKIHEEAQEEAQKIMDEALKKANDLTQDSFMRWRNGILYPNMENENNKISKLEQENEELRKETKDINAKLDLLLEGLTSGDKDE